MRFRSLLSGLPLLLLGQANANDLLPPVVTLDGSLPWQYASNPGRSSGSKHPNQMVSPYLKLSASGKVGPELSYLFYGSAGLDRDFNFADGNGSVAALGAHIGKKWEHVQLAFTYERGLYFDEYFRRPENVANDVGARVGISYASLSGGFAARPAFSAVMRADDAGVVQRTLVSARISFEKSIADGWIALLSPQLRHYEYQDARKGRRDMIFSISGGAKYDITRDISWTTMVGYEVRDSNVPERSYVNYVIGTSINFSFDLFGGAGAADRYSLKDAFVMPWNKR